MVYFSFYRIYCPRKSVLTGGVEGERYISILIYLSVVHARLRCAGRTTIPTRKAAYAGGAVMVDFMAFKINHYIVMHHEGCILVIANWATIVTSARPQYPFFLYECFNAHSDLSMTVCRGRALPVWVL